MPKQKANSTVDYPFLREYEKLWGAKHYYIEDRLDEARRHSAPQDAYRYSDTDQKWLLISDMPDGSFKDTLVTTVKRLYGVTV